MSVVGCENVGNGKGVPISRSHRDVGGCVCSVYI